MSFDTYQRANKGFEKAVGKLQDNLRYMAAKDSVSDRFIQMQNAIITSLINYQHSSEAVISDQQTRILELDRTISMLLSQNRRVCESFEAICLIHGITDLHAWINRGNSLLVAEAIRLHKKGRFMMPLQMRELINKLEPLERKQVEYLLYGRRLERERHKLLEEFKQLYTHRDNVRAQRDTENTEAHQQTLDFTSKGVSRT